MFWSYARIQTMASKIPSAAEQLLINLQEQVQKLKSLVAEMNKPQTLEEPLYINVQKTQARVKKIHDSKGRDLGLGEFFFLIDIHAAKETLYIPVSIASSKKSTGFVYQIEGTAQGTIVTTDISCHGDEMREVTLGTLLYCKLPAGKTATFRILVTIKGNIGKSYKIVLTRINYKFDPADARYKQLPQEISTKVLPFH